jgi:hypothetical protein
VRWLSIRSVSTLVSDDDAFLAQVIRFHGHGWDAYLLCGHGGDVELGEFPTRAAAMRAASGALDRKKGVYL